MEVDVAHLVEAELFNNMVAPIEVEVLDVICLVDHFVNIHQISEMEAILLKINLTLKRTAFDIFYRIF